MKRESSALAPYLELIRVFVAVPLSGSVQPICYKLSTRHRGSDSIALGIRVLSHYPPEPLLQSASSQVVSMTSLCLPLFVVIVVFYCCESFECLRVLPWFARGITAGPRRPATVPQFPGGPTPANHISSTGIALRYFVPSAKPHRLHASQAPPVALVSGRAMHPRRSLETSTRFAYGRLLCDSCHKRTAKRSDRRTD